MARHLLRRRDRRSIATRLALLVATVITLLATTGGIAIAYWGSTGSGSGQASTGTLSVTVNSVTPLTSLYPGGSASLRVNITNSNTFAVELTSVSAGTITASPGCATPAVTFAYTPPASTTIAAGTSDLVLAGAVSMSTAASSDCQGAVFSVPLTVQVQK